MFPVNRLSADTVLSTKYPNVFGDYLQMDAPVLILYGLVHFHLPDFHVYVLVWINFYQLTTWFLDVGKVIVSTWQGPVQTSQNQNVPGQTNWHAVRNRILYYTWHYRVPFNKMTLWILSLSDLATCSYALLPHFTALEKIPFHITCPSHRTDYACTVFCLSTFQC